jgi:uncharacterized protein (TIGR02246 family)
MSDRRADEERIRILIADWADAVRRRDYDGVLRHHSPDIVMFDVPPPFQSVGLEAYRKTWDLFFTWMADPAVFDISDVRITSGEEVAFATAHGTCLSKVKDEAPERLEFRLTIGLRKIAGQWIVEHEHHSLPAD